jgi:hypothetical protein
MRLALTASLVSLLASTGCASIPQPVAQPNGEPLSIREKTQTYTYNTQEKVGEVQHRASDGRNLGTSAVYVNRTHVGSYQVWKGYQGDAPISDDDFYRISKDKSAISEVESSRSTGVTLNRVGLGILAAGLVSMVGGYALRSQNPDSGLPTPLIYGGVLAVPVGGLLTYMGLGMAQSEHPLSQERAAAAADNYNRGLEGEAPKRARVSSR